MSIMNRISKLGHRFSHRRSIPRRQPRMIGVESLESRQMFSGTTPDAWLSANDPGSSDAFGISVDVFEDVAIVGAKYDDDAGSQSGSAYIFQRQADDSWMQIQKFVGESGRDFFGSSVAIEVDGDNYTFAISAPAADGNASKTGAIYVYEATRDGDSWDAWQSSKLAAEAGARNDNLGGDQPRAMAIDGDTIVAGAPGAGSHGAVHVFEKNGSWNDAVETTLTVDNLGNKERIGISVDIAADTIVAASYSADALYVFRDLDASASSSDWQQQATLVDSIAGGSAWQTAISPDGTTILKSTLGESVLVYERPTSGTWLSNVEETTAIPNPGAVSDNFGRGIDIVADPNDAAENLVVVGAPGGNITYLFRSDTNVAGVMTWDHIETFNDPNDWGGFGWTVVTDGDTAFITDTHDDVGNIVEAGLVYTVSLTPGPPEPPSPGITVTPTSGLETSEDLDSDEFTVVLDTQPTADVTINLTLDAAGTNEAQLDQYSLTFTITDWDQPQTVTVTGKDDSELDGPQPYVIVTAPAMSADTVYNGIDPADVSATNLDNETTPALALYVRDISFESAAGGHNYRAVFEIWVDADGDGQMSFGDIPAVGVAIDTSFAGKDFSGVTDSNGVFRTGWIKKIPSGTYDAILVDVALAGYDWDPMDSILNQEDDSDGDGLLEDVLVVE